MRVFSKSIKDNRRGWIGWGLALAALAAMYAGFWPSVSNPEMAAAIDAYPEALKEAMHMQDLTRPEGYLGSSVYGLLIPLLMAVFAISAGVRSVASDEEAGTLDLVLAHPVGRISLALQRLGAVAAAVAFIAGLVTLAVIALRGPASFEEVPAANIAAIGFQLACFGLFFGALAYAVGAWTGSRAAAIGAGAAAAVLSYLADSFLPQVEALQWTEKLSPFEWYLGGQPLLNGLDWPGIGLLAGAGALWAALGTWRFSRRDIAV